MRRTGYVLVATVPLVLLAAFVYGYPRVFPAIEEEHVDRYIERIAELNSAGKNEQAVRVARHATERRPYDPDAWFWLANTHLMIDDRDGAAEAAAQAVAIRQTMEGVPTQRPRYHFARFRLVEHALERGDRAAAIGHYEFGRRFHPFPDEALATHAERLGLTSRAAALRGEGQTLDGDPAEWIELENIRQYRPWEPCQLHRVRLGVYGDGQVALTWEWRIDGEPALQTQTLPVRLNEVPMDLLGRVEAVSLEADAYEDLPLTIPGFQTTPHLWHEGSRVSLEKPENAWPTITITRSEPGNALINTLPVRADQAMLVAVRVRAEGAPASITWLAEDARERESFRDAFDPVPPGEWTWRMAYHPASHHWEATWLQLGLFDAAGTVTIDQLFMLPVPDPPCRD